MRGKEAMHVSASFSKLLMSACSAWAIKYHSRNDPQLIGPCRRFFFLLAEAAHPRALSTLSATAESRAQTARDASSPPHMVWYRADLPLAHVRAVFQFSST